MSPQCNQKHCTVFINNQMHFYIEIVLDGLSRPRWGGGGGSWRGRDVDRECRRDNPSSGQGYGSSPVCSTLYTVSANVLQSHCQYSLYK